MLRAKRLTDLVTNRFTKEVLTRTFSSHDLSLSARNLLHDRDNPVDLYQTVDKEAVTATLKSMLDTIVLITESFFIIRKWLGEYVFDIAEGALLFRELICITKKGYSLRQTSRNPKAIVSIVSN